MAKESKYENLAATVVDNVGGKDNVVSFLHCVTRLRFNVRDKSKVDVKAIEATQGVMGTQWSGDQLQIIIGQAVGDAYDLICERAGLGKAAAVDENLDDAKKKFSIMDIFEAVAGSVIPVIPVLIGAGLVKVIVLLFEQFGVPATDPTLTVLTFLGDAGFYFLPVFVGAFSAKRFGANTALGMLMGAMLIDPNFVTAVASGTAISFLGIPVFGASYGSNVIPVILIVWVMSYVEKFFAKHSPEALRSLVEPLGTILVMVPLGFCLLGPIGAFLSSYLTAGLMAIYNFAGPVAVCLLAAFFPWIVMTGMHHAMGAAMVNTLATVGTEPFMTAAMVISNINQGAACLVVSLKSKDENLRSTAGTCAVTGILAGVTEPAMYGVNLKYMTPMYGAMIGSAVGGLIAGIGKCTAYAMIGSAGVLGGLPVFLGGGTSNFLWMVAGVVAGIVVTCIATFILYKPEVAEAQAASDETAI